MLARDALSEFQRFLTTRRVVLPDVSPRVAVESMVGFFREVAATDCDAAAHGDMLLFQWGSYDWGNGLAFEFDITRQFIPRDGDEGEIWQLSLTIEFEAADNLVALGSGDRWCHSRDELDAFATFVLGSPAFRAVADSRSGNVALDFENVE